MLKTIALENFVHFKDRTFIDFDTSRSKQSKTTLPKETIKSNPKKGDKLKRTDPDVQSASNALNIFVGANFCGKSTVIELIRRCMTEEINVSVTNSFNDDLIAYAFCKFGLDNYDEVISGIIKEPGNKLKVYKVFIYAKKPLEYFLRLRSSDSSITYDGLAKTDEDIKVIQSIFRKTKTPRSIHLLNWITRKKSEKSIGDQPSWKTIEDKYVSIIHLLHMIKSSKPREDCLPEEPSWKTIENKYVSTLPLRGIGMVQWTRSEKIKKEHKESNYRMACERAEVISTLLFGDRKDDIDEVLEEKIFQFITYPERFEFTKNDSDGLIYVEHNESESPFHLLKTSEGILEAKLTSLLLAHKHIQTLCLEDPDRGMHPQMIERLRTMLYLTAYEKTIIVVTHSPYFIDTITINKTHVFIRKERTPNSYECSVRTAMGNKNLSKVCDIETLRTLLFSTKVLLVEGVTDREVVEGIFTHIKREALKKKSVDVFNKDITTYQVIPVDGCENIKRVKSFCDYINLKCLCLWDLEKVVKFDETHVIEKFEEIDKVSKHAYNKKYYNKNLSSFIENEDSLRVAKLLESRRNTFIWRHGAIEDAILSSDNCNEEIRISLHCKNRLNPADLKNKLKKQLHEGDRKKFYAALVKVNEIDRFLKFLKEKEVVENRRNPKKNERKHLKSPQYICNIINVLIILVIILLLVGVFAHKYVTSG